MLTPESPEKSYGEVVADFIAKNEPEIVEEQKMTEAHQFGSKESTA